jgi:dipeptidyl-peptidase 4
MKQLLLICLYILTVKGFAQTSSTLKWSSNGNAYYAYENEELVKISLPGFQKITIATQKALSPQGQPSLYVKDFWPAQSEKSFLIMTNTQKVWRYETRGDFWLLNTQTATLVQLGKTLPKASLMFAKLNTNGNKAAYISNHNIYVEDIATGNITQLTKDGGKGIINGTFDWAYEEEFGCRDGFRWSPDGSKIAYWQIDARNCRNYYMVNNTDSVYAQIKPVEYPKAGQNPSVCKIAVIDIATGKQIWMQVPGNPIQHYIPRMEWAANSQELVIQQLNRKQQQSNLMLLNASTGKAKIIYTETEKAWIDVKSRWNDDDPTGWDWVNNGKDFVWVTEKDGWRHAYLISRDGKKETLLTNGAFDLANIVRIDEQEGWLYYYASPNKATQKYLYRSPLRGAGNFQKITPGNQPGTHQYVVSTNGKYAQHSFSNYTTPPKQEWIQLPEHNVIKAAPSIEDPMGVTASQETNISFFEVTTADGITMDGWMIKPYDFDSTKKYPVLFYVYSEPATQTVIDAYGSAGTFLYNGDMAADGYIQISIDGRGTPALKGREWRKSIYKKVGILNVADQAKAAEQILKWKFIDPQRVGVWGWSGGGSTTLNLLFQYGNIFKTGVAIAPVANRLTYDNIYEERYMGLPTENAADYAQASAITHAAGLKGKLLMVHGTGDDNVHYQNTEMLINELVKYNKQFQLMVYPNRTHNLSEGQGTLLHLVTLFTQFIQQNLPAGGR